FGLGRYDGALLLANTDSSKPITLWPSDRPEPPGTESPRTAPEVQSPTTIAGGLSRAGEVDYYRVALKNGQELGVHLQPAVGSKIEPVLALEDDTGNALVETTNSALGFRSPKSGSFLLSVRDREFRGGGEYKYRLRIGEVPVVTSFTPLGIQRGGTA